MINKNYVVLQFFIVTIFVAFFCYDSILVFGNDYGLYYANSKVLSTTNNVLYQQVFDHKGPLYYLFLILISKLIGFGVYQALFCYVVTTLLFFYSILLIAIRLNVKENSTFGDYLIMALVPLATLINQDSNISIQLFQGSFILWGLYFLYEEIILLRNSSILFQVMFFSLSIYVRIDSVLFIFFSLFCSILYNWIINKKPNMAILVRKMIYYLIVNLGLFLFLKIIFNYNFQDFFIHNYNFNKYYSSFYSGGFFSYFDKPFIINSILVSGLGAFLSQFFFKDFLEVRSGLYLFCALLFLFAVAIFIYTNSNKNYHSFVLLTPTLFILIMIIPHSNVVVRKIAFLFSIMSIYMITLPILKDIKNIRTYKNSTLYKQFTLLNKNNSFDNNNYMVGGQGWFYIFSNAIPVQSLCDWWLFTNKVPFLENEFQVSGLKKLLSSKDKIFYVHNSLIENEGKNFLLTDLLNRSTIISIEGDYAKCKIVTTIK